MHGFFQLCEENGREQGEEREAKLVRELNMARAVIANMKENESIANSSAFNTSKVSMNLLNTINSPKQIKRVEDHAILVSTTPTNRAQRNMNLSPEYI